MGGPGTSDGKVGGGNAAGGVIKMFDVLQENVTCKSFDQLLSNVRDSVRFCMALQVEEWVLVGHAVLTSLT